MLVTEVLQEVEVSVKIKALNVKVEMFFFRFIPRWSNTESLG